MSTTSTIHPLRETVTAAEARVIAATAKQEAAETDDAYELATAELESAEEDLEAARAELEESDCPREWELDEDQAYGYATITACSAEEALDEARSNVDRDNYPTEDEDGNETSETLWIDVRVRCPETGEEARDTVTCEAEEPECTESEHDWQSPHEILGGIEENPGVWGHGGGVIATEVCMHCGCARITDTWAQRPDTGEQGLTSVVYEPGKYADQIAQEES